MRTLSSTQYGIAITTLAILVATTKDTIWKYFAVLAIVMTAWFLYSLLKKKAG